MLRIGLVELTDITRRAERRTTKVLRLAALGDLHYNKTTQTFTSAFFAQIAAAADVMLLCGDLTDNGQPDEARALVRELSAGAKIPIVAVLGNHDFEGGQEEEIRTILVEAGVKVLDGDSCEILGVGFAGVKGFAGGYGRGTLGPWGEKIVKAFVQEAVNEALKLERALARLRVPQRIAMLHYAPVATTVVGEPLEIYPFLGCSRLEEPLTRYPVNAVFHGHAHNGVLEGRTSTGVSVYNVSLPLLRRHYPQRPFRVFTVPIRDTEGEVAIFETSPSVEQS